MKFCSVRPAFIMRTSNFQLWECCYWDNDLFPVGSQHSPPPPPKKKSWEWRGRVELAGNKQFCVFPSQLRFWLEIALNRTCVEGESPSPPRGIKSVTHWSELKRCLQKLWFYPRGIHGEGSLVHTGRQGRLAGATSQALGPGLRTAGEAGTPSPFSLPPH